MRTAALTSGISIVLALFVLGGIFGLNGATWNWWRWASYAAAAVAAIVAARLAWRRRRLHFSHRSIAAILVALAAIAACASAMAQHFNDSYNGTLLWPRLLACGALAAFVVAGIAVARAAE